MQVGMALTPNSLARRKPGVQIPSPPPPNQQVRASPASSGRRSLHVAAALRPQAQVTVQPKGSLRGQPTQAQASHNDHSSVVSGPGYLRRRSSCASSPSHGRPGPLLATSHDDDQWRPSAGPARPGPASNARLQPRADDPPSWTWRARGPGIPAVRLPAPPPRPATSFPSDTADAGARDAQRTPDTGHLDAQTPAPDTRVTGQGPVGHQTLARGTLDTGYRTPEC